MTLFIFGNEYLKEDSFAHHVARHLSDAGVQTIACRSPDDLLDVQDEEICIMDVVKGIKKPMLLKPEQVKTRKIMSLHDFDLGYFLQLLTKMGIAKHIRIIGIPQEGDAKAIAEEVKPWLKSNKEQTHSA